MTADEFRAWEQDMIRAGRCRAEYGKDADLSRLLGASQDSIINYRKRGAPQTVALACSALLMQLGPYPDVE